MVSQSEQRFDDSDLVIRFDCNINSYAVFWLNQKKRVRLTPFYTGVGAYARALKDQRTRRFLKNPPSQPRLVKRPVRRPQVVTTTVEDGLLPEPLSATVGG